MNPKTYHWPAEHGFEAIENDDERQRKNEKWRKRITFIFFHRYLCHQLGSFLRHQLGSLLYHQLGSLLYHQLSSLLYHQLFSLYFSLISATFFFLSAFRLVNNFDLCFFLTANAYK